MDNDTLVIPPAEPPRLPPADMPAPPREAPEGNGVFRNLVKDDTDIAGLVAYSIYKQNKLDWLGAFEAAKGRAPDDKEFVSYILGEGTPRRLATYRHLAEATLAGKGPDVEGAGANPSPVGRVPPAGKRGMTASLMAAFALIGVLSLIVLWLALHFAITSR